MRTQRLFFLTSRIRYNSSTTSPRPKSKNSALLLKYQRVNDRLLERTKECDQFMKVISEKNQEIGRLHQTIKMIEKMSDHVQDELDGARTTQLVVNCVVLVIMGVVVYYAFFKAS